jgi:hypothetical protein
MSLLRFDFQRYSNVSIAVDGERRLRVELPRLSGEFLLGCAEELAVFGRADTGATQRSFCDDRTA